MSLAHVHPGPENLAASELPMALAALMVAVIYVLAAGRLRRRGDLWPRWRDASFTAGSIATAWAAVGRPPGGPFTGHMIQHLVLGMGGPLLLIVARPLTLALRALPPGLVRRALPALMRFAPARWLVFPPLAALLNVGGLWLLYRTELFAAMADQPWLHGVVHAHVLAAGLLFTFAVCQLDPVRHRWGVVVRGAALLAAGAAHGVLAKILYAQPPPGTGFTNADLHKGAQLMYYGGDAVGAALALVLGMGWYAKRARTDPGRSYAPLGGVAPGGQRKTR